MAPVITHVQTPPERLEIDYNTGVVQLSRTYDLPGYYPTEVTGIGFGSLPGKIPHNISGTIQWPLRSGKEVTRTLTTYLSSMSIEAVSATARSRALCSINCVYEGLVLGSIVDSFDVSTESRLQVVDIDKSHADSTTGQPRSIGPENEGTNVHSPVYEWVITENVAYSDWKAKRSLILILAACTNEKSWAPTISGGQKYLANMWLYLGASVQPFGRYFLQLSHHFAGATLSTLGHRFWYRQYEEKVKEEPVDEEGGTVKTSTIYYGPEQAAQVYPQAGQNNEILGVDRTDYEFADLEL